MAGFDPASGDIALALQGGGAHAAVAWGMLDRLVERGLVPRQVCGVSAGALLGVALVQGLARGGASAARAEMRRLWERIAAAQAMVPPRPQLTEPWTWGLGIAGSLAQRSARAALRYFAPADLNPLGLNPLSGLITELLDRTALTAPGAPRLIISATDVETGHATLFDNAAIDVDALLASCCLPFLFPPVRIGGRTYWDGGYSGNPPLAPLLRPNPPETLVLVRAQPAMRPGVPDKPAEIHDRIHEIACEAALSTELATLPGSVRLVDLRADQVLLPLPVATKFSAGPELIERLFEAGRLLADRGESA